MLSSNFVSLFHHQKKVFLLYHSIRTLHKNFIYNNILGTKSMSSSNHQNQVVIFKSKNDGNIFSHAATVKRIASYVNDHYTLCSLAQTCRWCGEFVDDNAWKGLAGLQDYYKPPSPFPSFVSYFRTFVLEHKDFSSLGDTDNDDDDGKLARDSLAHIVVPRTVKREGQLLRGESIVSNPSIVRFGPHIKKAHVLLVDRPEHVLVGYCTENAPHGSHSVSGPHHWFTAIPYMLRGFIIQVSFEMVDCEKTNKKKKFFRVKRTEFNLEEKILIDVEVRTDANFDQLAVCLAANNACCAII